MSVNAISAYSSATQYKYFSAVVSTSQLQSLMEKYGIRTTGDQDKDLEALYQVMYSEAASEAAETLGSVATQPVNNQTVQDAASTQIPWANLMTQVGLSATGNLEDDYAAFNNQINAMKASGASSQSDRAYISLLMAQAGVVFVQDTSTTQAAASSARSAQPQAQSVSGVDIIAQLNKMYMLGA